MIKERKIFRLTLFLLMLMFVLSLYSVPKTYAYTFDPVSNYQDDFTPYKNSLVASNGDSWDGIGYIEEANQDDLNVWISTYSYDLFVHFTDLDASDELCVMWSNHDVYGMTIYWDFDNQIWLHVPPQENKTPVYNGQTAFVTNIDNPMSINEILVHIDLIDNEDGVVTDTIEVITDTYTMNTHKIGTYTILLRGHDSSGNYADLEVTILIKDVTVPVITGTKTYNQTYTTKKDVNVITSMLSATDNYDVEQPTVILKSDNYSSNYNKVGSYTVVYSAKDKSGNEGLFNVTINVIDDVKPVFNGIKTILKGQSEILTVTDIVKDITVNDAVDGALNFTVKTDNFTGNGAKTGVYTIVLEAVDNAGNIATHTITVTVADNIPPVYFVDNYFITVSESLTLTRQDIIDLLVASGQLEITTNTVVNFTLNEYEGNESQIGTYAISLEAKSLSGLEEVYNVAVLVEADETGDLIEVDDTNIFQDVWNWVKSPVKNGSKFYKGYYVAIGLVALLIISPLFAKRKRRW